jgi:hypothetical protein
VLFSKGSSSAVTNPYQYLGVMSYSGFAQCDHWETPGTCVPVVSLLHLRVSRKAISKLKGPLKGKNPTPYLPVVERRKISQSAFQQHGF